MATAGFYIAEAHVMKKFHKEKMKQIEEETAKRSNDVVLVGSKSSSIGCFGMFKKIHPANNVVHQKTKGSAQEEVNNWDSSKAL